MNQRARNHTLWPRKRIPSPERQISGFESNVVARCDASRVCRGIRLLQWSLKPIVGQLWKAFPCPSISMNRYCTKDRTLCDAGDTLLFKLECALCALFHGKNQRTSPNRD